MRTAIRNTDVDQEPAGCPHVEDLCGDGGFLALSRFEGEDIVIEVGGETILIRNIEVRGNKTRIGVMADKKTVKVHRREVWEAIHAK